MSLVTEDVIINLPPVLKWSEEKQHNEMFWWPILYGNKMVVLNIILLKTIFTLENEKCNEKQATINNAMKNNQQGRQSKSPFKTFTNYIQFKILKFSSSPPSHGG